MKQLILYGFFAICALFLLHGYVSNQEKDIQMQLSIPALQSGNMIPSEYTCDGDDSSPELLWGDIPATAKSLALICQDPDAQQVAGKIWVHWLVANIPTDLTGLEAGYSSHNLVTNAVEGMTDFNTIGYGGPCPPHGSHRYYFTLYAVNVMLDLPSGFSRDQLLAALRGHIVAQAEVIGTYERTK